MGFIGWRGEQGTEHIRARSLTAAVEEMRKDADRIFDDLLEVAGELDEAMGVRRS